MDNSLNMIAFLDTGIPFLLQFVNTILEDRKKTSMIKYVCYIFSNLATI